jgi:hypothetical protein
MVLIRFTGLDCLIRMIKRRILCNGLRDKGIQTTWLQNSKILYRNDHLWRCWTLFLFCVQCRCEHSKLSIQWDDMEESSPGIIWGVLCWHLLGVFEETPQKTFVRTAGFPTWNGTFCMWSRRAKLSTLALCARFWNLMLRKEGSKFVVFSIPISYWEGRGSNTGPETSHTGRHFRRYDLVCDAVNWDIEDFGRICYLRFSSIYFEYAG